MGATSAGVASATAASDSSFASKVASGASSGGGGGGGGFGLVSQIIGIVRQGVSAGFKLGDSFRDIMLTQQSNQWARDSLESQYNRQRMAIDQEISASEYDYRATLRNARYIQEQVNEADERLRTGQGYQRSAQMVGYGKSGVALASGSPLAVMAETAGRQELESAELRRQGRLEVQKQTEEARFLLYKRDVLAAQKKQAIEDYKTSRDRMKVAQRNQLISQNMGILKQFMGG